MSSEIRQVIENSHLFSGLDPGLIDDIAASATKRALGANELLFQKGDRADALWGVLSGRVVIEVRTDEGKEMLLDEFQAGDVFGEVGVLDFGPRRVEAVSVCPTELFRLERSHFLEHLQTHPELCFRVFSLLCGHLRNTTETLEDTALYKLPDRLAKRLLVLAKEAEMENGKAVLKVFQSDLARMMGVHREAVNRQLKEWEKSGWIAIRRQRIEILDKEMLIKLSAPGRQGDHSSWGRDRNYSFGTFSSHSGRNRELHSDLPEKHHAGILAISCSEYATMLMTDSAKTVKRIKEGLAAIDRAIKVQGGRVIWSAGERTLAEFPDGSGAMAAALEIQKSSDRVADDPMQPESIFRMGIHCGEVFDSDGSTIGDPVNIAILLTELPGSSGICFTDAVRNSLVDTGGLELNYVGRHELVDSAAPIGVFSARAIPWPKRIALWADAIVPRRHRRVLMIGAALLAVAVIWLGGQRFGLSRAPGQPAQSIAVLSFELEGDSENAYLADGFAEEIRSALARVPGALVIGKKSSDYFKEWNASGQEIGEILRVAYVLHGAVGLNGDELNVSSRLIETANGTEIWHHRQRGSWQEFNMFQAEIVRLTGEVLESSKGADFSEMAQLKPTDSRDAYVLYLQARELMAKKSKASLVLALEKLERALDLEPDFAAAHVATAQTYLDLTWFTGFYAGNSRQEAESLARPHVKRALTIDPELAEAYLVQAQLVAYSDAEAEKSAIRKAISLNPNLASAQLDLGIRLCNELRSLGECLPYIEKAMEIEPLSVEAAVTLAIFLRYIPQRRDEALAIISNLATHYPDHTEVNDARARWLQTEGRVAEAIPIWQSIMTHDPDYYPAPRAMTVALFSLGETQRALESPHEKWEWNLVLSPDREVSIEKMRGVNQVGWAKGAFNAYTYLMLHEWQKVIDSFPGGSRNLDEFRANHEMMLAKSYSPALSLAVAYKALGDEDRYRDYAELEKDAVNIRWANDGYYNHEYATIMARLYALEGDGSKAMLELRRLIVSGPNDPRELLHPAYDGIRETDGFRQVEELHRSRINEERTKLGLLPIGT